MAKKQKDETSSAALYDRTHEEILVGSLLLSPKLYHEAELIITAEDFLEEGLPRKVYEAIGKRLAIGEAVDAVLIAKDLFPDDMGARFPILNLTSAVPSTASWQGHAKMMREMAERREGAHALVEAMGDIRDLDKDAGLILRSVADRLEQRKSKASSAGPFDPVAVWKKAEQEPEGVTAGLAALDDGLDLTFNPGDLVLIAARPSHGKTALLANLFYQWAERLKREESEDVLLFYTAEEDDVRLMFRFLAIMGGLNGQRIRDEARRKTKGPRKPLDDDEHTNLRRAQSRLLELTGGGKAYIVYCPSWTSADIAAHARGVMREGKQVAAVFVDYIQKVLPPPGKRGEEARRLDVTAIAISLKDLAMELQAPLFAGSQISRESQKVTAKGPFHEAAETLKNGNRPQLHNLSESAGLDHNADVVLGLYNPTLDYVDEVGDVPRDGTPLWIRTLKSRYGVPGREAKLLFVGETGVIRDYPPNSAF